MEKYLILNLIIAHVLTDFYLQFEAVCQNKLIKNEKGWGLWTHFAAVLVITWIVMFDWKGWWVALSIAGSHLVIDWVKSWLSIKMKVWEIRDKEDNSKEAVPGKHNQRDLLLFIIDQSLHIVILVVLAILYCGKNTSWNEPKLIDSWLSAHMLRSFVVLGVFVVMKPANILVLQILGACRLVNEPKDRDHGNFHSGALIGCLERTLILLFVILSQYEAIGFLIAAKSILRFNSGKDGSDSESEKSEYVITGTLLSLTISLLVGISIPEIIIPLFG